MGNTPRRLTLRPLHLVRAGPGLDAVRIEARGFGFVLGSLGLLRVRGSLEKNVLRRFPSGRCRALFLGLHGLAWASVALAPAGELAVPRVGALGAPEVPGAPSLPDLAVDLSVTPPETR